jgi:transcriptional regulator with XRE-family HTH domain
MADEQTPGIPVDLGSSIRRFRELRSMSQRELARRAGISSSALSQIESGKSQPSVNTLYEIVRQLETTLDALWLTDPEPKAVAEGNGAGAGVRPIVEPASLATAWTGQPSNAIEFLPRRLQQLIVLEGDERMRRLGSLTLPGIDCVTIEYAPRSTSPKDGYSRHSGHEFNFLISGELEVEVGEQTFRVAAGDTLAFPSTEPHRLSNVGDSVAEALTVFIHATTEAHDPSPHS